MTSSAKTTFTVLVTGANSGLGYAICCRFIDEFLTTRPQSHLLHLLYSTRDARKSEDTRQRLNAHLQKTLRRANSRNDGVSLLLESRVKIEGVLVDLMKLRTVKALAEDLLRRNLRIDAVVWNAGTTSWTTVNFPKAFYTFLTDPLELTIYGDTWHATVGLLAKAQGLERVEKHADGKAAEEKETLISPTDRNEEEPKLGQVFLSNVFGHYLLTHYLSPLFTPASKIIWVSSTSAQPCYFNPDDIQGIQAKGAYESSKRLMDLLVLNSESPSCRPYVSRFLPTAPQPTTTAAAAATNPTPPSPKMYTVHPGVVSTSIMGHWLFAMMVSISFYISRWIGSPWHPVSPYKGAISAVFAALAPPEQFDDLEVKDGKGKWGSATDIWGNEWVARTEVEGWGWCGVPGRVPVGSVSGKTGRFRAMRDTTAEMRVEFEEQGRRCWREMEELRVQWEARLGPVRFEEAEDV